MEQPIEDLEYYKLIKIKVTKSVEKTDYYKKLKNWNVNVLKKSINDQDDNYINISIYGIENFFIELYFDLQDDLEGTLEVVDNLDKYNLYYIMKTINEYFYFNDSELIFPLEVSIYLIKIGYKNNFLSDKYYLPLLYENPEIFDVFLNKYNNRSKLIYLQDDILKINEDKYSDHNIFPFIDEDDCDCHLIQNKVYNIYDILEIKPYYSILNDLQPYNKSSKGIYSINNKKYRIIMSYIYKILDIPGVIIHGEYINSLIHGKKDYDDSDNEEENKIIISFYGELDNSTIINNIVIIANLLNDNVNSKLKISHNSEYIYIDFNINYEDFKTKESFKIFKISKNVYTNINDVLESHDLDSESCGLYKIENKTHIVYTERYKLATENCISVIDPNHLSKNYNIQLINKCNKGYKIFVPGKIHLIGNYKLAIRQEIFNNTLKHLLYKLNRGLYEGTRITLDNGLERKYIYEILDKSAVKPVDISDVNVNGYLYGEAVRLRENFDINIIRNNLINNGLEDGDGVRDRYRNDIHTFIIFDNIDYLEDILNIVVTDFKHYKSINYNLDNDYLSPENS